MITQSDTSKILIDTVVFYGSNEIGHKLAKSPKPHLSDVAVFLVSDYVLRHTEYLNKFPNFDITTTTLQRNVRINAVAGIGIALVEMLMGKSVGEGIKRGFIEGAISLAGNELVDRLMSE